MLTAGIDLAAENTNTAVAWIRWTATGAVLEELVVGAGDDELLRVVSAADKVGIDCPLGWPEPFVEFIIAHHRGKLAAPTDLIGRDWRRKLAWRRTDVVTHELTGRLSLSVAADRIAHTAMRCAAVLARLAEDGHPVDRSGGGTVVEVYPAASLKQWGLPYQGSLATGPHPGAVAGSFVILDFPPGKGGRAAPEPSIVYSESLTGALYLDKADELTAYERVWKELVALALTEAESSDMIKRITGEMRHD